MHVVNIYDIRVPHLKETKVNFNLKHVLKAIELVNEGEIKSLYLEGKDKIVELDHEGILLTEKLKLNFDIMLTCKTSNIHIMATVASVLKDSKIVYLHYSKSRLGGFLMELIVKKGVNKYVEIIAIEDFIEIVMYVLKKDGKTLDKIADIVMETTSKKKCNDRIIIDALTDIKPKVAINTMYWV